MGRLRYELVVAGFCLAALWSVSADESMCDSSRRREASMYDWSEAYRGCVIVRDTRTGAEMPANLAFVHEAVDGLNQAAGGEMYQYLPLREWWQGP